MSGYQVSEDYLLNHAYRNVWCTPEQDKQVILKLPRITPPNGVWAYFNYQWRKVMLPGKSSAARFHVYQVGQVHPSILGLLHKPGVWISAKEAMEKECVLLDIYTAKGIMIPRCLCWYIVLGNNNLLVAVAKPVDAPRKLVDVDLETDDVFMRLYSNAYFNSIRSTHPEYCIRVDSVKANFVSDVTDFQNKVSALPSFGGVMYYINGRRVNKIDLISAKLGDYIEYVFDASIKREITFKVRDLQEFESSLDNLHKYLLHYPDRSNSIDYHDDIDMYLTTTDSDNRWQGAYVHKNDSRTMRMVTHRDYSVPVIRIDGTQEANSFLQGKEVDLRLTMRHSGYNRPLVHENNRIAELYKLPLNLVQKAMVGLDATVSIWEAAALEASGYTELMRQPQGSINRTMVQKAYGYNAMSLLLGNTPQEVTLTSGQRVVEIPEALRGCCTIYEYSAEGLLLYYEMNTVDNTYSCRSSKAAFVEIIYGLGGVMLDIIDNTATGTLNKTFNYRFYVAPGVGGVRSGPWEDKTGDAYYLLNGNNYEWVVNAAGINRILSNKRHLAYSFEMAPLAGAFEFDITFQKNGVLQKLDMPLGELDIFFNGHSLIEGLDYKIKDARVIVTAKKYYDATKPKQAFTIRYTGFCNKDMTRTLPPEVGFVYHGNLSANNRFDIHDDRVLRIVCGGKVRLRKDLDFAEDGIGVSISNASNGAPYAIRDIVVPMNNYLVDGSGIVDETYEYRKASQLLDEEVGNYLTRFLPETNITAPNAITSRYQVYSPYLSRILADLQSGKLWDSKFQEHFGDDWLQGRLASYDYLLDFDPMHADSGIDDRYVVIHPHPYPTMVELNMYQYRVLDRLIKILGSTVDLSGNVYLKPF